MAKIRTKPTMLTGTIRLHLDVTTSLRDHPLQPVSDKYLAVTNHEPDDT